MLFNSFEYLVFLPLVFCLYWFVSDRLKWQNALTVAASCVFYGWWDFRFLFLIAFTSLCSFFSGILIEREKAGGRSGTGIAVANVAVNLLVLGVFKYFDFFVESLAAAFSAFGVELHPVTLKLILPVGISFYTFQALSYTIDVHRGKLAATRDPVSFFAFICFFPQLVAGPIERATNLLPQFQKKRVFDYATAVDGTKQILWGLFKKMVVADNCADVVDKVWLGYPQHSSWTLAIAAILFAFQIYGDFSGYSDIAIGTGKLFGIRLMRNFDSPYFSRSVSEFWKRWHISLNTWFVDYVYIPLGGSREGRWKTLRNTFAIFLLSGLWHGANWTYVLWGLYHAALFLPSTLSGKRAKYADVVAGDSFLPSFRESFRMLSTFALVCFGWIVFRAGSLADFAGYVSCMFANAGVGDALPGRKAVFFALVLVAVEWVNRKREHAFAFHVRRVWLRWGIYLVTALLCLSQAGKQVQFIYFQF